MNERIPIPIASHKQKRSSKVQCRNTTISLYPLFHSSKSQSHHCLPAAPLYILALPPPPRFTNGVVNHVLALFNPYPPPSGASKAASSSFSFSSMMDLGRTSGNIFSTSKFIAPGLSGHTLECLRAAIDIRRWSMIAGSNPFSMCTGWRCIAGTLVVSSSGSGSVQPKRFRSCSGVRVITMFFSVWVNMLRPRVRSAARRTATMRKRDTGAQTAQKRRWVQVVSRMS